MEILMNNEKCYVEITSYKGKINIQIYDEEWMPYATASTQIDGLENDEVGIKNWSENQGILLVLISNNIVENPHRMVRSGFVTVPICRLTSAANELVKCAS